LSTLPLEGRSTQRSTAVRFGAKSWISRTPALVIWDALITLALFAVTVPLAGSPLFDQRWQADGVGALSAPAIAFAMIAPLVLAMTGGYEFRQSALGFGRLPRLLMASGITAWVVGVIGAIAGWSFDVGQITIVALVLPFAWVAARRIPEAARRRRPQRVLIVGSGQVARHVADLALRHPERGLSVVGCIDDEAMSIDGIDPPLLGRMEDLSNVLQEQAIDRVIVSFSLNSDGQILRVLRECDSYGVDVDVVPRLFDLLGPSPEVGSLGGLGLLTVRRKGHAWLPNAAKRAMDIVVSATMLTLTAPIMLAVAIAIRLDDGKPVLFRQTRIGRDGRPFEILKFRTMRQGADKQQASELIAEGPDAIAAVSDAMKRQSDAWITPVGHFLRRTSLDELPQLWNVLRGDMSLVGPRPLRQYEVDALTDWESTRQEVRPGITGLWQILGRSDIRWNERMQLDYSYVRHWSFVKDVAILARTAAVVLARKGAV
jgi:exopolysaccharide biosynthesis polyprenyl glycosylphosphotransferase